MSELDIVTEYLLLGLRFDRIEDGFVDAYFGDPALKAQVANEPAPLPADLAARARELRAALPESGLSADRQSFLEAHLTALETNARKLVGEQISFVDEVDAYFQVRPSLGDEDRYADAHAAIDRLLPGSEPLAERYHAFRQRDEIPPGRLEEAVQAFSSALRDRVRATYGLPEAETVAYEVVTNEPWAGFNYYLGDFRSRVAINADLPVRRGDIPHLVAHESYPGHHTEHCRKERGLVDDNGHAEQTVFLVNTPSCLMAEGLADLGLRVAVGRGWGRWAEEIYADLGLPFEGERAEEIALAGAALKSVRQDAALMLHDRGVGEDDVVAFVMRWELAPEERARKAVQFLTSPLWRAYISTYVEGYALLAAWLEADGNDAALVAERYRRLLDEPLTPAAVATELAAASR